MAYYLISLMVYALFQVPGSAATAQEEAMWLYHGLLQVALSIAFVYGLAAFYAARASTIWRISAALSSFLFLNGTLSFGAGYRSAWFPNGIADWAAHAPSGSIWLPINLLRLQFLASLFADPTWIATLRLILLCLAYWLVSNPLPNVPYLSSGISLLTRPLRDFSAALDVRASTKNTDSRDAGTQAYQETASSFATNQMRCQLDDAERKIRRQQDMIRVAHSNEAFAQNAAILAENIASKLRKEKQSLSSAHTTATAREVVQLKATVQNLNDQLKAVRTQAESHIVDLGTARYNDSIKLLEQRQDIKNLEIKLDAAKTEQPCAVNPESSRLRQELAEKEAKGNVLQVTVRTLKSELEKTRAAKDEAEHRLQDRDHESEVAKAEVSQKDQTLAELNDSRKKLERKETAFTQEILRLRSQIAEKDNELRRGADASANQGSSNQELAAQLDAVRAERDEVLARNKLGNATIDAMRAEINTDWVRKQEVVVQWDHEVAVMNQQKAAELESVRMESSKKTGALETAISELQTKLAIEEAKSVAQPSTSGPQTSLASIDRRGTTNPLATPNIALDEARSITTSYIREMKSAFQHWSDVMLRDACVWASDPFFHSEEDKQAQLQSLRRLNFMARHVLEKSQLMRTDAAITQNVVNMLTEELYHSFFGKHNMRTLLNDADYWKPGEDVPEPCNTLVVNLAIRLDLLYALFSMKGEKAAAASTYDNKDAQVTDPEITLEEIAYDEKLLAKMEQ